MLESPASIIDERGGPAAFAAKLGLPAGVVRAWKHRNSFPRKAWPEIVTVFPDISLDRLMEIEAASAEGARP